jgi:hypothetical protein
MDIERGLVQSSDSGREIGFTRSGPAYFFNTPRELGNPSSLCVPFFFFLDPRILTPH